MHNFSLAICLAEISMIEFLNFRFYTVDIEYLRFLYSLDSEVMYSSDKNYKDKPFLGTLITVFDKKYLIPLTSAKKKHVGMKDISEKYIRIYELVDTREYTISDNDIIDGLNCNDLMKLRLNKKTDTDIRYYKKKILSVLMIGKMIPITDSVIKIIDISIVQDLDKKELNKRILLNKEYNFCLSSKKIILNKARNLYEKSLNKKSRIPYCCDFRMLEYEMNNFSITNQNPCDI